MAILHGKTANIYWDEPGTDTNLTQGLSWTADITHDAVAETTDMQDTWKTYLGGFQDWVASVTCLLPGGGTDIKHASAGNPNALADVAAQLELFFIYATNNYKCIYGLAICNGIAIAADKDGIPTVTYSFQGSGQLAWDSGVARVGV